MNSASAPQAALIYSSTMEDGKFIITTSDEVAGYEIVEVIGEVFGLICRARNVFSNIGASLRTLIGGEVGGYTQLLTDSRRQALERLKDEARRGGGNAVVAMRFDCNEIANMMSEIAAYGTAVVIRKKTG
ncbi:MAG: YbjQ family protein [Candidatus Binataceae bacterium]